MKARLLIVLSLVLFALGQGQAVASKPIQLSLVPPIQLFDEDEDIVGLRLQIYGRNASMKGLDLGIAHDTINDFTGVGFGVIPITGGKATGAQWSPFGASLIDGDASGWFSSTFYHSVGGDALGLQGACVSRCAGDFTGWHYGLATFNKGNASGLLTGVYTDVRLHMSGVQVGIVNRTASMKGFQLGIVNITEDAYGIQVGIWNHIGSKEVLRGFPFANYQF